MKTIPLKTFMIETVLAIIVAITMTIMTQKKLQEEKYYTVSLEGGYEGEHD